MAMASGTVELATFERRLGRVQADLRAAGVSAMLVGPSSDFFYLTGHDAHASERLTLLVVPADEKPFAVVPRFEAVLLGERADLLDVHAWQETDDPIAIVAGMLGMGPGSFAVSQQLWSTFLIGVQAAIPGRDWRDATPLLRPLRMVKDDAEVALLREAGRRTDVAWEAFIREPISGQTEREALARLTRLTTDQGLKVNWGICASGPNAASPHHHTGERVIGEGDAVVFDWGGTLGGYNSDVTRTIHVGEPGGEFRRVYDVVRRANQATLDAVRPGASCASLDATARDLITAEGYGDAFLHRVGHGLGLDVHEEPYLVAGNDLPLEAGMVFSDEPGIYLDGRFGVRIEDAVVCTATGGERLNEATRDLVVLD
ncbi:MAG: Xaa-Pro peptidase family protein [Chloroflexota bacterium]|nr:Xaa-Pro peptidase family protein [Chloroflexota bacterium]